MSLRRAIVSAVLLGGVILAVYAWERNNSVPALSRPNIILITFDALRADHLGFMGYSKNTSPFLDELAKHSVVFTDCVTATATTQPSMAAIFTSQYPYLDKAVFKDCWLTRRYKTMAELLQKKGYVTIGIPGIYSLIKYFRFQRGFNYYDDQFSVFREAQDVLPAVRHALDRIDASKKRVFLWIHFREPHDPYEPPGEFVSELPKDIPMPSGIKSYIYREAAVPLTNDELERLRLGYDGNIRYADHYFKEVFNYLIQKGILPKAVVIVTADHGEGLGEHGYIGHGRLDYEVLHVPLLLYTPNGVQGIRKDPVATIDILPTLFDILGDHYAASKFQWRGASLLKEHSQNRAQFSEYPDRYSIIQGDWQLLSSKSKTQLFSLKASPVDHKDMTSKNRGKNVELEEQLQAILRTRKSGFLQHQQDLKLRQQDIEAFRSLGYLH